MNPTSRTGLVDTSLYAIIDVVSERMKEAMKSGVSCMSKLAVTLVVDVWIHV